MLTELGITYPQYLVLMVLWEKDCQPVNDIAHRLMLETNTVTPLLQRMEKLGIISRKRGEQDKRQHIVSLTAKGREMEQRAYDLIPTGMSEQLASFKNLTQLLTRLKNKGIMAHQCENCKFRAHYDQKPNSLLGRFWRWHINFCPGWKGYFTSLSDEQKDELRKKYQFTKYQ